VEKWLYYDDEPKESKPIQEKEKPDQYPRTVLEYSRKQNYSAERGYDQVYYDVI
jgi:hypothetical protein